MCRAVKCRTCGKTTWAGCGQHVEQVKRGVKPSDWCEGHHAGERKPAGLLSRLMGGERRSGS